MSAGVICERCSREMGDNAYVCTACSLEFAAALHRISEGLDDDLFDAMAKLTAFGGQQGGKPTKASEAPMPISPRASEARSVLRNTLTTWVRVIYDDGPGEISGPACADCAHRSCRAVARSRPPADTMGAMARWLAPLAGWVRHAVYGAEVVDEVVAAVEQALRVVDSPIRLDFAGTCWACKEPVYAPAGVPTARCRTEECPGGVGDVGEQRLRELRRLDAQELTPAEAEASLERAGLVLSAAAIRGYAHRGVLVARGKRWVQTRASRPEVVRRWIRTPVYRLGDIIDIALGVDQAGERRAS